MGEADLRAQRRQPLEMQIDRAGADGAAAGEGDPGAAEAGQQRPEDQHRGAHGLDQVVGRLDLIDAGGIDLDLDAAPFDPGAEGFEQT